MPGKTNNPFRSVALLLISLTIITLGIVYNQTISSPSSPKTSIETKGTNFFSLFTKQQSSAQMGATTGQSTAPTPTPSTAPTPGTGVIVAPGPTPTITTPAIPETYQERLGEAMRLLSSLTIPRITFAQQALTINIPGVGLTILPATSELTIPEISLPSIVPSATVTFPTDEKPPTTQRTSTTPTIKDITGYSQWEKFKENFRESQQKYAGTGKCMINIAGFGCLVTW